MARSGTTLLLWVAASCGPGVEKIAWPGAEEALPLMRDTVPSAGVSADDARMLRDTRARLLRPTLIWEYGTLDGDSATLFGRIEDITTDVAGNTYVLDSRPVSIRVFSPQGHLIGQILRDGDGPLEMREPRGLAMVRGDTLAVISTGEVRFLTGGPTTFGYGRNFTAAGVGISGLCALGDSLYKRVSSRLVEGLVQVLDYEGREVGAFGELFSSVDRNERYRQSLGRIACSDGNDAEAILTTTMGLGPYLYGYSPSSGRRRWVTRVAEFDEMGSSGEDPDLGPFSRITKIVPLPPRMVLIEVTLIGRLRAVEGRAVAETERVDYYLLSDLTGAGIYVGSDVPNILHASERRLFVDAPEEIADADASYPQLEVYEW